MTITALQPTVQGPSAGQQLAAEYHSAASESAAQWPAAALRDPGGATPVLPRPARGLNRKGMVMPWASAVAAGAHAASLARDFSEVPAPAAATEFFAECVAVRDETDSMRTVYLRRCDGAALGHRPGQYIRLALPVAGSSSEPLERCYSISTSPVRRNGGGAEPNRNADSVLPDEVFAITVKRQRGGIGSNWLHDVLEPGMVLEAQGPLGGFHLPDFDRRGRYLLLAAGAGITPLLSMVRTLAALPGTMNTVLVYHCSKPGDFAFGTELEELAAAAPGLAVYTSLGDGGHENDGGATAQGTGGSWHGLRGRIGTEQLNQIVGDACGRQVYACGPAGYLRSVRHVVADIGVSKNWYFEEVFDDAAHDDEEVPHRWRRRALKGPDTSTRRPSEVPTRVLLAARTADYSGTQPASRGVTGRQSPAQSPLRADGSLRRGENTIEGEGATAAEPRQAPAPGAPVVVSGLATVTFSKSQTSVAVADGETLLDAGRRAGVPLKSNCRTGQCGTCKVAKLAGEVAMAHGGGIRQREIDAGKILLCCSTTDGDVTVDG